MIFCFFILLCGRIVRFPFHRNGCFFKALSMQIIFKSRDPEAVQMREMAVNRPDTHNIRITQ